VALSHGQQTSAIYWLVNAEPYRAVFNDPTDPDYVGGITDDNDGVSGLDSPEIRESLYELPSAHGAIGAANWAGPRPVTLAAQVNPNVAADIAGREDVLQRIRRAGHNFAQDGQLIWFPGDPDVVATTRRNLISNPSFEYNVTNLAPDLSQSGETGMGLSYPTTWYDTSDAQWTSKTFQVTTNNPTQGSKSLRIAGTKDANTTNRTLRVQATQVPVKPSIAYSARANVNITQAVAAGNGWRLRLYWYDSNLTLISSSDSNVIGSGTSGAQTLTANNKVAPSNAAWVVVSILAESTGNADVVNGDIDAVQLEEATAVGTYFDGDSANASWLGPEGFSPSVNRPNARFLNVRTQQPTRIAGVGFNKSVLVSLVARDPLIYSTAQKRVTVAHATDLTIENEGDWESPAIYRVMGPYGAGTVTIQRTANTIAEKIKWTKVLDGGAGHSVWFDTFYQLASLDPTKFPLTENNVRSTLDWTVTDWPGIMPGLTNTVRFDASGGGTTGNTFLEVRWRDAWL
jgi:hypothetical protein